MMHGYFLHYKRLYICLLFSVAKCNFRKIKILLQRSDIERQITQHTRQPGGKKRRAPVPTQFMCENRPLAGLRSVLSVRWHARTLLRTYFLATIYTRARLHYKNNIQCVNRHQASKPAGSKRVKGFATRASVISLSLSVSAAAASDLYLFRSSKTLLAVNINGRRCENCL
jgi:hypothetical protein